MDTGDFTIKTIRAGGVCTLILCGELDFSRLAGSCNVRHRWSMTGPSGLF